MDPTAQPCSHWQHSAAMLERRSHCQVAPAVRLLVVIGTVDNGQYSYMSHQGASEKERKKNMSRQARQVRGWMSELTSRYFAR